MKRSLSWAVVAGLLVASLWWVIDARRVRVPEPGSPAYVEVVRVFYRGLASLDTGLLDQARQSFASVTTLAPDEPAGWANLALASLRGAEFETATQAAQHAAMLAPNNADIALLNAALEISNGRLDSGVASLRRAITLDPDGLRARYLLIDALGRQTSQESQRAAQQQVDELAQRVPDNLAVLVEGARLATLVGDVTRLRDFVNRLAGLADGWPDVARERLTGLQAYLTAGDTASSAREIVFLKNVLARVPAYRDGLAAVRVPSELIAEPIDQFLQLAPVPQAPAPADMALTFRAQRLADQPAAGVVAWPMNLSDAAVVMAVEGERVSRLGTSGSWPAPADSTITGLDWNNDFRTDLLLAGRGGVRLLVQDASGNFVDRTSAAGIPQPNRPASGAWAADLDMDGDLDLVVGLVDGPPLVLRNNGDGTLRPLSVFTEIARLSSFAWLDVDRDGDPDATLLTADGAVHIFSNQQAGAFAPLTTLNLGAVAIAVGDLGPTGTLDLITCDRQGVIRRIARRGDGWDSPQLATSPKPANERVRLMVADLDNNGASDLVLSADGASQVWLSSDGGSLAFLTTLAAETFAAIDLTDDGYLDLLAVQGGYPVRLATTGTRAYHWQVIRPRAQTTAGDQRINSLGVGGEIEVRSGLITQKQVLTGLPIHVGLGINTVVDVARIIWPNGVMQAEFDAAADRTIVAEQRLKGSCPWVFADNGVAMSFVTDFLWRSPLGLRINAQDTAGITQTEDWVRIRGDQLVPRASAYDLRITAELWETHFVDHVSLMTVDHPVGTEMFIDERFGREPQRQVVQLLSPPTPILAARDDAGHDLIADVVARDGRYSAGFERGAYQGVAPEHSLEIDLGPAVPADGPLFLVAQGWVYPTDSSINVAIAQGGQPRLHGLMLEAQDAAGAWRTLNLDLGFPAGKNKTMLIDVRERPSGARRFRLRTNMEIYWDALAWATPTDGVEARTQALGAKAELRYRGFSLTTEDRAAHVPETPSYGVLAAVGARWRDLVGYHTRFGDVSELVSGVDDRYVIMNAGDELRLSFPAPPAPPQGWRRDFVLIGDGWEKDGDFNTEFSQTVLPLPRHGQATNQPPTELEQDPVYLAHPDDWQRYQTRFVAPDRYLRGLQPRRP